VQGGRRSGLSQAIDCKDARRLCFIEGEAPAKQPNHLHEGMVPSRIRNALVLAGQATEVQAPIVAANVKRSCPGSWCSNGEAIAIASGGGSIKLPPRAGRLMMGSSLNGAMIPAHVTSALDRPFVVLFEQQRPDQTRDGVFIGEDADNIGASLDFAVEALGQSRSQKRSLLSQGAEGHLLDGAAGPRMRLTEYAPPHGRLEVEKSPAAHSDSPNQRQPSGVAIATVSNATAAGT